MIITLLSILVACSSQKSTPQPMHIHPHLDIIILGEKQAIPGEIGLSSNYHNVIHTHDPDGILHVESPITRTFYLKEFFAVWDKKFDDRCIFDHCADNEHNLKVYVNDKEDARFGDIVLEDNQNISIVYQ
jgi:hypothetical protein